MSKGWHPPAGIPFPVAPNATTVGPQVVQPVTVSPRLEALAYCGVLEDEGRKLRIFRRSTTDPDNLSCEVYEDYEAGWRFRRKERVKYAPPESLFPPGSERSVIEGIPCASTTKMSREQERAAGDLLRRRPA